MDKITFEQLPTATTKRQLLSGVKTVFNKQIESKMRILANYLIDRVLEIQNEAIKKGLNINQENVILIMEHKNIIK